MKVSEFLNAENIIPELKSTTKNEVLNEFSELIASNTLGLSFENISGTLLEREKLCSTAMDEGVAIPHGKIHGISKIIIAIGRSIEGVDFDSLDGKPTHLFIVILSPESSSESHIKALAKISKIFKSNKLRSNLLSAQSAEEIYELIIEQDESTK